MANKRRVKADLRLSTYNYNNKLTKDIHYGI